MSLANSISSSFSYAQYIEKMNLSVDKSKHPEDTLLSQEIKKFNIEPFYNFMVFSGNNEQILKSTLRKRGNFSEMEPSEEENIDEVDFVWKQNPFSQKFYWYYEKSNLGRDINKHIIINHIEGMNCLCTKTGLIKSLKTYYSTNIEASLAKYNVFYSTPTTFLINSECDGQEYYNFSLRYQELTLKKYMKEKIPGKHCINNIWIVKPSSLNQGQGIKVLHNFKDIKDFIKSKSPNTLWIVQKYIEKPLLYYNRKFDIRIWSLITSKGELYYYKQGYLRTSSDNYTLANITENYIHLTNNCLQKHGNRYGFFEDGNTISFDDFKKYLKDRFPDIQIDFEQHIIPRIKDLVIDCYLSGKDFVNQKKRRNCFELLGFDFLVDEDFRVWLIEVNHNPYLGIPNKFISQLLPEMIEDLFELVVDPIFQKSSKKLSTPSSKRVNKFELLYSEIEANKINQRRPMTTPIYPIQELAQKNAFSVSTILRTSPRNIFCATIQNSQLKNINEESINNQRNKRNSRTKNFNLKFEKFKSLSKCPNK